MRIVACLCLALLLLSGCTQKYEWQQKLTMIVETPTGLTEASSVSQITLVDNRSEWNVPDARGVRTELQGEAVVMEVAPGRYLFWLLDGVEELTFRQFGEPTTRRAGNFPSWVERVKAQEGNRFEITDWSPLLVTFDDIDDPASVRRVPSDNLAEVFGEGYALQGIYFEVTSEPVTDGSVFEVLEWLPSFTGRFDPVVIRQRDVDYPFASSVSQYNFRRLNP